MQKVLQDKQISGFELGFLVESGVRKSPATAVTAPGDDRTYVRGPIVTDGSAPAVWLDAEGNIDWDASAYEAQEYQRRWEEIDYWVQVEAAAELHTMDVLMGRGTPPVFRVRAFGGAA